MSTMKLVVECRRCRQEWIPAYQDVRAGYWHTCGACKGDPSRKVSGDLEADSRRVQGQVTGRKCQAARDTRS